MRAYALTTGTLFTLFALMHAWIAYQHWRNPAAESPLWPALIGLLAAALAVWAFRVARERR